MMPINHNHTKVFGKQGEATEAAPNSTITEKFNKQRTSQIKL